MARRIGVGLVLLIAGAGVWMWTASDDPAVIRAPRPEVADDAGTPFVPEVSSLPVPVRIDLATLLAEVEAHVPVTWGSLDEPVEMPDGGRATSAVELEREPFRATLNGSIARLSTTVSYRVRGTYDLPLLPDVNYACGTAPDVLRPRLDVALRAPIGLTSEWALSTRTEVLHVAAASEEDRDRCEVTAVGVDITGRVVESARRFLEDHRTVIDSLAGAADVRSSFESWWELLRDPVQLDDDVWLEIRPEGISRGSVDGEGSVVEILANLEARPRIVLGARPAAWARPLPPLHEGVDASHLDVLVEAIGEYEETSALLEEALRGLRLSVGTQRLEILGLALSGIGAGRVALEVEVGGTVEGRLFLVGTPEYDPETGYASVPDLAFSVSTTNLLVAGASWIAEAGLESMLRERARWPVDTAVDWAAEQLDRGLNRALSDQVRLEGDVHEVRVRGVRATTRALVVVASASADAALVIDGPR